MIIIVIAYCCSYISITIVARWQSNYYYYISITTVILLEDNEPVEACVPRCAILICTGNVACDTCICNGPKYNYAQSPTKSFDFEGFDSSRLLILRGGNSHVR